jgi:hypothetical protein
MIILNLLRWIMRVNFHFKHFYDYCMSIKIDVEHYVIHDTHTQNGLVESFIKRLQLIA